MFVDSVTVHVLAGRGGDGCIAFRREKCVPRGGPSGGNGGRGGSVVFIASTDVDHLVEFKYRPRIKAPNGAPGEGSKRAGRDGEDIVLPVPVGTIIKDVESNEVLCDLRTTGDRFVAAEGGRGGVGNAAYATPTRRAPRFAKPGLAGEERTLVLELKTIADVGLVGFPNVGKSLLISRVSRARPEVADYPFTTLTPHPGVVELGGYRSFVIADIPGILEGAHKGIGLGHQFLKHIERTTILLLVVDASPFCQLPPREQLIILGKELKKYSLPLSLKPRMVAFNKTDLLDEASREALERAEKYCRRLKMTSFRISALRGDNLKELLETLYARVYEEKHPEESFPL